MWSCTSTKLSLPTNYNKTDIRIHHIHNICGLKEHLSDFLKPSVSQIDLVWFSRAFHQVINLYEHAFMIISVLGLGNLKVISLLKCIYVYFHTLQNDCSWDMVKDDNKPEELELVIVSQT